FAASARPAADGRRVLLVDDSVSIRKFVGQMLERGGVSVVTANDGVEALQRLWGPDVDVGGPHPQEARPDGLRLVRDIPRRPATRDVPVVVLTTRAGEKHVALARELGVTHYVTKPVDERSFVRLVDELVQSAALVSAP